MTHQYRTHTCGQLRASDIGNQIRLSGWIQRKRDLGGVLFVDLRDNYGLTQIVAMPGTPVHATLDEIRVESTVTIDGTVRHRGEKNINKDMPTGEVEIELSNVTLQGNAEILPFPIIGDENIPETARLTYRFLDLRRQKLHDNILLRSKVIASIRKKLTDIGFNEFQTPILTSSSPEGARDYLVPSRLYPGKFYALPQAPQQFKQLLMVAGFDRYFQIAPCFRDEDARADRSPGEFYQLDLEMSFVTQDDVFATVEKVMHGIFVENSSKKVTPVPFPRIPFLTAMEKYGSDKPDLRFGLEITELSDLFKNSQFNAFKSVVEAGGVVRAIAVPGAGDKSRKFFDELENYARELGAKGLATLNLTEKNELRGTLAKPVDETTRLAVFERMGAGPSTAILIMADSAEKIPAILGKIRTKVAGLMDMIPNDRFEFCWITDFPMFEKDPDTGQIVFSHNPFSMPQGGLEALQTQDPLTIKAFQYDIVCNGVELSSGAIRNHRPDIMFKAFEIAGYSNQHVEEKFAGMLNAFRYGAPPHGGIAPGIDRIVMLIADEPNIREVICFPMNQNAQDLMMKAPCEATPQQLKELNLIIANPEK